MFGRKHKISKIVDTCIEGMENHGWMVKDCLQLFPDYRREIKPYLEAARAIQDARLKEAQLSNVTRNRIQARLMARVKQSPVSEPVIRQTLQWSPVVATLLVIIVGIWSFRAADATIPGQALYPLDQVAEAVQLMVTPRAGQLDVQMAQAEERLVEAEQAVSDYNATAAGRALIRYNNQVDHMINFMKAGRAPNDIALFTRLDTTLADHEQRLTALLEAITSSESLNQAIINAVAAAQQQRFVIVEIQESTTLEPGAPGLTPMPSDQPANGRDLPIETDEP